MTQPATEPGPAAAEPDESAGSERTVRSVNPVPVGHRLLHIGIPKTGTTALQTAAATRRSELATLGVCYPGPRFNHREAAVALMGRNHGWTRGNRLPMRHWDSLVDQLTDAPGSRGFVSHEFIAECDDEQAQRFVDALGPDLHVVVSLRGFADLLGSTWQQYVKAGNTRPYGRWLRLAVADPPSPRLAPSFGRRNDQAAVVQRWVRLVGPERLTVVIADKARPTQLTDAFEDLLDLPRGLLRIEIASGAAANRTLSLAEAELIRGLNVVLGKKQVQWRDYDALIRSGVVPRLQEMRRPGPKEPRVTLPRWAARRALVTAERYAAAVVASGATIVGDPAALYAPVPTVRKLPVVKNVPADVAIEALAGLMSAATGQKAQFTVDDAVLPAPARRLFRGRKGEDLLQAYGTTRRLTLGEIAGSFALRLADRVRGR